MSAPDDFTAAPFNAVTVALREAHAQALETIGREGVPAWQGAEARRLAAMCEAALAGRGYAVTVKEGRVQGVVAAGPHAFAELADDLGGPGAFSASWRFHDVPPAPPPVAKRETLASALEEGAQADIWFEPDHTERRAAAQIRLTRKAMRDAAKVLRA